MDVTSLASELTPYVVMALPYLTKTGEKAAEVVTEKLTEAGLEKIKALWQRMRSKIEAKPAALEAVQDALQNPDKQDAQAALRRQLQKLLEGDAAFASEVAQLWVEAKTAGINVTSDGDVKDPIIVTGDENVTIHHIQVRRDMIGRQEIHHYQQIIQPPASEADATLFKSGSAPPLPLLIIGREEALSDLKTRLGGTTGQLSPTIQVLTAVRGWPGVGKTTLAAALAHDSEIAAAFPDGVLWATLGQKPSLLSELAAWGRVLGADNLLRAPNLEAAATQLTALLRNKRMMLIVDDVWEAEHAMAFKVGGRGCAMLVTTRVNSVAQAIAPTPDHIYKLAELSAEKALDLLKALAPTVVAGHPQQSLELVRELEGLPLAIQVAGHLLNVEASYGFGVTDLITELRAGAKLLEAKAPADRADLANETIPTVAVLLQKSTERLDPQIRDRFAYLGAFAPKPATFDLAAMKAVWQVEDPKPTARILTDRGLLEPIVESERFQMHALLVLHARSLCSPE